MNALLELGPLALLYTAWVPLTLFIYSYARWSRWWATGVGRMMMSLAVGLWAIISLSLSRFIFRDDWYGLDIVRLVIYLAMNIVFWSMFITLRNVQKPASKHPLKPRHEREKETTR